MLYLFFLFWYNYNGDVKMKHRGKKKNGLKVLIIIGVLIIVGGLGYFAYNRYMMEIEKNKLHVYLIDNLKVEINTEILLNSFVKNIDNGVLLNGDNSVDTSKLGKQSLELLLKNKDDEEEKYNFDIDIVDTTKPVIEAKKERSSYVSNKVDLLDGVKVTDNSKEEIKAVVNGEYDINKAGKYNLKYEAVDSSGNKGEYDFTLSIIDDPNNRSFTTSKGFSAKVVDGVTYVDGYLIANKTYSLPKNYGNGLTWETQDAFNKMKVDASSLGLGLWISSGYRSYWDQNIIYNNYVARDGQANADTYSARPGHSEHQSGLAFDLNSIDDSFTYTPEGKWVHDNCYRYGLILRYPLGKEGITGYMHESWHMRYVGKELASKLYNNGDWITMEEYFGIDSKYQ